MVADFLEHPATSTHILAMAGTCSAPGTWQRQLLEKLLTLPFQRDRTWNIAAALGWTVINCDIDVLDQWFRTGLAELEDPSIGKLLARALYRSGKNGNVLVASGAIFDRRFDDEVRTGMASAMVDGGTYSDGVELLALGYQETGGTPPSAFLANRVAGARDQAGVLAKRRLLAAVLSRANGEGAIPVLNAILSDALTYDRSHPWFVEVGDTVESIAQGSRPVPAAIRSFVAERANRFRASGAGR
jgi:hypothetical protein